MDRRGKRARNGISGDSKSEIAHVSAIMILKIFIGASIKISMHDDWLYCHKTLFFFFFANIKG